jgi:hypothetical protein
LKINITIFLTYNSLFFVLGTFFPVDSVSSFSGRGIILSKVLKLPVGNSGIKILDWHKGMRNQTELLNNCANFLNNTLAKNLKLQFFLLEESENGSDQKVC